MSLLLVLLPLRFLITDRRLLITAGCPILAGLVYARVGLLLLFASSVLITPTFHLPAAYGSKYLAVHSNGRGGAALNSRNLLGGLPIARFGKGWALLRSSSSSAQADQSLSIPAIRMGKLFDY